MKIFLEFHYLLLEKVQLEKEIDVTKLSMDIKHIPRGVIDVIEKKTNESKEGKLNLFILLLIKYNYFKNSKLI
jgi:hypothetical protein